MPASMCSGATKTHSRLIRKPLPTASKKQWKCQLSNPEEKQPTTKRGKKMHGDDDDDNEDDDDNDDDDNEDEGKEVGEEEEGLKWVKSWKRVAKTAKCVPGPPFFLHSNSFKQEKGP